MVIFKAFKALKRTLTKYMKHQPQVHPHFRFIEKSINAVYCMNLELLPFLSKQETFNFIIYFSQTQKHNHCTKTRPQPVFDRFATDARTQRFPFASLSPEKHDSIRNRTLDCRSHGNTTHTENYNK